MLYLITNRNLITHDSLVKVVEQAVKGGVDRVILREKDLPTPDLISIAKDLKKITNNNNAQIIVNSNLVAANAVNADGYHMSFQDFITQRPQFNGLIGVSVHNLEEATEAAKYAPDYLLASHIFETDCKKGAQPRGIQLLNNIKSNTNIPVIALGGIKPTNVKEVLTTKVHGIAAMSYIMESNNPYQSAHLLKSSTMLKCAHAGRTL